MALHSGGLGESGGPSAAVVSARREFRRLLGIVAVLALALIVACCWFVFAPRAATADSASSDSASAVSEGQQLVDGSAVDDETGLAINGFSRKHKGSSRAIDGQTYGYYFSIKGDTSCFIVLASTHGIVVFIPQSVADETGFDASDPVCTESFMNMVYDLDDVAAGGLGTIRDLDAEVTFVVGEDTVEVDGAVYTRDRELQEGYRYLTVERTDGLEDKDGIVCCDYGYLVGSHQVATEKVPTWWENLVDFLTNIDYRPLFVSLKTSFTALAIVFVLGLLAAWKSMGVKSRWKGVVDTIFTIPMVLPPTVCGFLLLLLFGNATPVGQWLMAHGVKLVFTWPAAVIAATVVAFPLMYRTSRGAFEALDSNMLDAARTLGWSERKIFYRLMIPLAWPSIAAGTVLAFARAMGEFGATLFCAGNYAGVTQTMPIAIYFKWMGGETDVAIFWVIVVILISFLVILVINLYSAHSQRYRRGGLTRKERKLYRQRGTLEEEAGDDQSFQGIRTEDAASLLGHGESDAR